MLNTIRAIIDDDVKWRGILVGLNKTFWHQTVTGQQVRDYISQQAGTDLGKVFAQYQTTTQIPELQYRLDSSNLAYRWANVVPGFAMPVRVQVPGQGTVLLHPTESWQTLAVSSPQAAGLSVDENFFVTAHNVGSSADRASPGTN
jgi:aminopeptidase N